MNANSDMLRDYNYSSLIYHLTDALIIFRIIFNSRRKPEDYLIEYINPSFEVASGLNANNLVGRSINSGIPFFDKSTDWLKVFNQDNKQLSENLRLHKQHNNKCVTLTIFKDEDYVTVLLKPLKNNDAIMENYLNSYSKESKLDDDISIKKESELIEAFPQGILVHRDDKIIIANKAAAEIFNTTQYQLIDKSILEFVHPEDIDTMTNVLRSINNGSDLVQKYDIRGISYDSCTFDLEFNTLPFQYTEDTLSLSIILNKNEGMGDGESWSVLNNGSSVEQILEYDRMKTDFFSNISHEFKTPLNVILGTLQLMSLYIKDASVNSLENKMKQKISIMQQNCYRLLRLVNNIIDITKMDRGYYQINLENHNIIEIIEVIALSVKDYIEGKGIRFNFNTDIDFMITACDPDKIERIILNLLSNAIKFTKAGGEITVHIKDKNDKIQILVKDTGIGIAPEKTDIIFERFIQVDKSFAKDNIGSGIGLSLVKSLVEMHRGSIYVESQLNVGSEFIIELPIFTVESKDLASETTPDYRNGPVEKINIEFSDIYYHK